MRGIWKNNFYSPWAQPKSYLMVTTFTGRLLIQQATLPLFLFPPPLLYHLSKYKDLSPPFLTLPNQCIMYDSQQKLKKTPSQETDWPKSGFLVLIIPNYEGLMWPYKRHFLGPPSGCTNSGYVSPSFPFETLRFQGRFWFSNAPKSTCLYTGRC